jgi:hypothetical protein
MRTPRQSLLRRAMSIGRVIWLISTTLFGLYLSFRTQTFALVDQNLFWNLLPSFGILQGSATLYFFVIRDWSRWIAMGVLGLTLLALFDMASRVL